MKKIEPDSLRIENLKKKEENLLDKVDNSKLSNLWSTTNSIKNNLFSICNYYDMVTMLKKGKKLNFVCID